MALVQTRPYDFGTDAIERQRVSLGQSLIDADFEYGLQATKWQTFGDTRKVPSFYEIPGSDIPISSITHTSGTVTVNVAAGYAGIFPAVGTIVFINGLQDVGGQLQDRAQGFFRVTASTPSTSFTYNTRGGSLIASGSRIDTSLAVVRRGGYYGGTSTTAGAIKLNAPSLTCGATGSTTFTCTTSTPHGLLPGMQVYVVSSLITAPGQIAVITNVGSSTQFQFTATAASSGTDASAVVYIHSAPYVIHRPFDGGVLLSTQNPAFGASICRQSKKVFRYQSGKGLLWSSGTLFCPNNDIVSVSASGTAVGSTITIVTSIPAGIYQTGSNVILRGITTSGYNGTYTISSITNNCTFTVLATQVLGSATPVLGDQPRFIIPNWNGASVRVGCFDDQNGLFWEYDGQTLWAVKRSSTFQLAGTVTVTNASNTVTGSGTRFSTQLRVNDKVTIRGMTYVVTGIQSDTSISVNPPYRGGTISTVGVVMCKIKEQRTPQSLFNRDTLDGRGQSGFIADLTKMQMVGLQYTWYGAGFVDFMMRGQDGNWVYAHRYRQNNMNDEAYMRSGNLPVRYEIVNETQHAQTTLLNSITNADTTLTTTDDLGYWPSAGTVWCNGELISYTGKTSNTLTGCTRSATLTYNILDTSTALTGSSAASINSGNTVHLTSLTCSPSLTHWGSAFIMDGQFDSDRGYLFNYSNTSPSSNVSFAASSTNNIFLLRLAPSVSNGVVGDTGARDLLNRAQLLLQRLDFWVTATTAGTGSAIITGILNPVFSTQYSATASQWIPINSPGVGSQPSFAQVYINFSTIGSYTAGSGERVFSTICNAGAQYSIDLSGLKEVCNNVIGGSNFFPDGPDTLLVQISVPPGAPTITQYAMNLFWGEAQA
mgnify:CR=1 FL=1